MVEHLDKPNDVLAWLCLDVHLAMCDPWLDKLINPTVNWLTEKLDKPKGVLVWLCLDVHLAMCDPWLEILINPTII